MSSCSSYLKLIYIALKFYVNTNKLLITCYTHNSFIILTPSELGLKRINRHFMLVYFIIYIYIYIYVCVCKSLIGYITFLNSGNIKV